MPSDLENLQTAYSNAVSAYKDALVNPKPDYSINGQSVSWSARIEMLRKQIAELKSLMQAEEGPFMIGVKGA